MSSDDATGASDIARYFQAQYADFKDDLAFYRQQASRVGDPILELGCGTGRVLLPLAAMGFEAVGVDHDRAMLNRLQDQYQQLPDLHLVQAELSSLPLTGLFRLVLAPCSTMAFLDESDFAATLHQLRRIMAPGARLIMDLPAPEDGPLAGDEDEILEVFHEPERDTDIQLTAEERRQAPMVREVDWHYDEMLPDGYLQRRTITTRYHLRTVTELESLLDGANLSLEAAYGDYQQNNYRPGSAGLIIVATN